MAVAVPARIGFLGLGLITGSLARALRQSGWEGQLVAWDRDPLALAEGLQLNVIDAAAADIPELLSSVDLLVVGTPPMATAELLTDILPRCERLAVAPVVTDVASIKGYVCDALEGGYPFFVPGHPIAGSEDSGVAAGRGDLFRGREVILTPRPDTSAEAQSMVTAMWRLTGAWVSTMSIADHDAALAASSHSPHMVAYALTAALGRDPLLPMRHGGGALRDMTRIAGSDPVMWRDVAVTNRDALLNAMDDFSTSLAALRQLVVDADAQALHDYFLACRQIRREHDQILNPLPATGSQEDSQR
jgi:cyclohexadieny/prephenate dehydrogenase